VKLSCRTMFNNTVKQPTLLKVVVTACSGDDCDDLQSLDHDLSPEVHPAMGGILFSFEPVRLGDATGRGAEPSTQRSVPSCCIADAVSLA